MARQQINLGTPNGNDGDIIRDAFNKVNQNFIELYTISGGAIEDLTELSQDFAAQLLTNGNHVGITVTYDDDTTPPKVNLTGFTGNYNDLTNKPTIPAAQVNSDWDATSGISQILNKPNLALVATSGSYIDLADKPTIPAAQVNSDWTATSGVAQILNKPVLSTVATSGSYTDLTNTPDLSQYLLSVNAFTGNYADLTNAPVLSTVATSGSYTDLTDRPVLSTVATSGSYTDLTNKPTIPTVPTLVSAFTNDAGYLTSYTETDPIFSAWDRSTGISITESQITDLKTYLTSVTYSNLTEAPTFDGFTSTESGNQRFVAKAGKSVELISASANYFVRVSEGGSGYTTGTLISGPITLTNAVSTGINGTITFPDATIQSTAFTGTIPFTSVTSSPIITVSGGANKADTLVIDGKSSTVENIDGGDILLRAGVGTSNTPWGEVKIQSGQSYIWTFADNGVLRLPPTGDIHDSTGRSVLIGGIKPQVPVQDSDYNLVYDDIGRHIYMRGDIYLVGVPHSTQVNFPIGTTITIATRESSTDILNSRTTDQGTGPYVDLYVAGLQAIPRGIIGVPARSTATLLKVEDNVWIITGTGLTV